MINNLYRDIRLFLNTITNYFKKLLKFNLHLWIRIIILRWECLRVIVEWKDLQELHSLLLSPVSYISSLCWVFNFVFLSFCLLLSPLISHLQFLIFFALSITWKLGLHQSMWTHSGFRFTLLLVTNWYIFQWFNNGHVWQRATMHDGSGWCAMAIGRQRFRTEKGSQKAVIFFF